MNKLTVKLFDPADAETWYRATRISLIKCKNCGKPTPILNEAVPSVKGVEGYGLQCGQCRTKFYASVQELRQCETIGVACPKCGDGEMLWNENYINPWQLALVMHAMTPFQEVGDNLGFSFDCPDCGTVVMASTRGKLLTPTPKDN